MGELLFGATENYAHGDLKIIWKVLFLFLFIKTIFQSFCTSRPLLKMWGSVQDRVQYKTEPRNHSQHLWPWFLFSLQKTSKNQHVLMLRKFTNLYEIMSKYFFFSALHTKVNGLSWWFLLYSVFVQTFWI